MRIMSDVEERLEMWSRRELELEFMEAEREIERLNKILKFVKAVKELLAVDYESASNEISILKKENEMLKEALNKCDPFYMSVEKDCPRCNQSYGELYCIFCDCTADDGHAEDCEYIKLTKGLDNNV